MDLSFLNEFIYICNSSAFISNMLNVAGYNHCKPVVLSRGDFAPEGHLPMSEGDLDWQGVPGIQGLKAGIRLSILCCTGQPPQRRITWSRLSTVPGLGKPDVKQELYGALSNF